MNSMEQNKDKEKPTTKHSDQARFFSSLFDVSFVISFYSHKLYTSVV